MYSGAAKKLFFIGLLVGRGVRGAQRPPPTGIVMNLDANIKKSGGILSRGDFVTGGFCRGGILSGDFVAGGFCPGGFCHGA